MKNLIILLTFFSLLAGCKKDDTPEPLKNRSIGGEWITAKGGSGGYNNFDSFKNVQYNFEVGGSNQVVDILLSSDVIKVQYALFDPLGQKIYVSPIDKSVSESHTMNAGKYRLVICADRRAVGKFGFTIKGVLGDPNVISSQILDSGSQNWGTLGGGGRVKTFKNHFYTFDITDDNTSIDVEMESADTEISFILYDELGTAVANQSGQRYESQIKAAKKGTYTLMAGTNVRGSVGNYVFRIAGKVNNLQRVVSQSNSSKGSWTSSSAADKFGNLSDTYSLKLTSNNSSLDIELSSSDSFVELYLAYDNGTFIDYNVQSFLQNKTVKILSRELPTGLYKIIVQSHRGSFGTYTINTFGQFTDFKKL